MQRLLHGFRRWIVLLAFPIALAACTQAIPLQRSQTASLVKGATSTDVAKILGSATLALSHEFDSSGQHYLANHYDLQTGARQEMRTLCTPTCVFYTVNVPVTAAYVMIYEGRTQQLAAWGTIEELSRSPDEGISSIMPDLKASYDTKRAEKKKAEKEEMRSYSNE